eukprot:223952-Alexandrium_andersonii.AAC.1
MRHRALPIGERRTDRERERPRDAPRESVATLASSSQGYCRPAAQVTKPRIGPLLSESLYFVGLLSQASRFARCRSGAGASGAWGWIGRADFL